MIRYIDANALVQDINQSKANNNHNNSIAYQTHNEEHKKFIKMVLEQPTANVVEVKLGEWKLHPDGSGTCSCCNRTQKAVWDYDNKQNFCGHCGADMRGDEK